MRLKDAKVGEIYDVQDIQFCDGCELENDSCEILGLMERGLIPGSQLKVISKKLGMYELNIDGTHLIIRESQAVKFNIILDER